MRRIKQKTFYISVVLPLLMTQPATGEPMIEEVTVTAQKWEQSLQDTPISIVAFGHDQLEQLSIGSLDALETGLIPSLRMQPTGLSTSTKLTTIRGNGPSATNEVGREGSVAIYKDGVFISRAQGLSMNLIDLERVEVLRGPQGTLFGRNATAGAISLISKKPSGKLGIEQTLGTGTFDSKQAVTRIDFPTLHGVKVKLDYAYAERDGWVKNSGSADYNAYEKEGVRLSINYQPVEHLEIDVWHEQSNVDSTQLYFQLYDNLFTGNLGAEPDRENRTRYPISPLDPTDTNIVTSALKMSWTISEQLVAKSITANSALDENMNNNFGGALGSNGLIVHDDIDQDQFTQEFQIISQTDSLQWASGVYYLKEKIKDDTQFYFTRDSYGCITGTPNTPIAKTTVTTICAQSDPTNTALGLNFPIPLQENRLEATSKAVYSQATWAPEFLSTRLSLSAGLRYTKDEKSGYRDQFAFSPFNIATEYLDKLFIADYEWSDTLSTYLKWSTGYKAGGIGLYSNRFLPYDDEQNSTWELGLKSEFSDGRIRFNGALFSSRFDDMQIDFADPVQNVGNSETFNAAKTVKVSGAEFDITAIPIERLVLTLSYTYLDGDMPVQPNPIAGGALQSFEMSQTPQHAGAFTVDYQFKPWSFGKLAAHLDITATDKYAYVAYEPNRMDAYKTINARLALSDIGIGSVASNFTVSIWGKNLTDEEYVVLAFPTVQAFGTPRTAGVDISYSFH
jgi:iron complex outermembrane recepter protein